MSDIYRKCVKCGSSAARNPGLSFHSFPKAGKASSLKRLRLWVEYCFPGENLLDAQLKDLYKSHKLICSKHFHPSSYTNASMERLNRNAVPGQLDVPPSMSVTQQSVVTEISTQCEVRNFDRKYGQKRKLEDHTDQHKTLHLFPNPRNEIERFQTWVNTIGGNILGLSNENIYKHRRVCHAHFAEKYWCRNNRISNIAVPTLLMAGMLFLFTCINARLVKHIKIYTVCTLLSRNDHTINHQPSASLSHAHRVPYCRYIKIYKNIL